MNTDTGEILQRMNIPKAFLDPTTAEPLPPYTPLTPEEHRELQPMNRAQRRSWAKKNRRGVRP